MPAEPSEAAPERAAVAVGLADDVVVAEGACSVVGDGLGAVAVPHASQPARTDMADTAATRLTSFVTPKTLTDVLLTITPNCHPTLFRAEPARLSGALGASYRARRP